MLACLAVRQDPEYPLNGLELREITKPEPREDWALVRVVAAALNHHDIWTLRGVGHPPERLPIVLGADAAGYDEDGNAVVIYPVIGDPSAGAGDETLDPDRALLSEKHNGTLAEFVCVPRRNLAVKPPSLTFDEAACLPVAWLTAYRMLFTQAKIQPGCRVLVQGAGGGVASAAIALARAAGVTVYATSRSESKLEQAVETGAHVAVLAGERLPHKVDAVIETVGAATWEHSLRSLKPGGALIVAGATTGPNPPSDLARIFYHQLRVLGSTGGTSQEFARLLHFVETTGIRPRIDRVVPLSGVRAGLQAMLDGQVSGKVVVHPNLQ
ncbi:zinc-binding dehydrogenase [Streptomycetaceae bacterium NBC_01309]